MFMRKETRDRWKHRSVDMQARRFRAQQHSPPAELPADTISIYTDGSGDPREIGKPPPPAGYGFVAVRGGRDHKKGDAVLVAKRCGQVTTGMRNVKTVTSNLAELVAFTRALQWATHTRYAAGRPICIRYDSTYAAMIASGTWRAKKHKAMAEEARGAWITLKRVIGERLWMRHVKGHSGHPYNDIADKLADTGKQGVQLAEDYW